MGRVVDSIAAVVVTFNRKQLLAECLTALLQQSRPLEKIYVIDQGSTDGTQDLLREQGILTEPTIEYWRSPVNTGGAGGFHAGMKKAYDARHAWIWIMDDDAIPDSDACEKLLPFLDHPQVVAVANHKLKRDRQTDNTHIALMRGNSSSAPYCRLRFSSFVGLLVSRRAIEKIGLPKAEFFFMYDDNEYCARLLTCGDIAYASDSFIVHKEADAVRVRKHLFGWSYSRMPVERYWRNYFSFRNSLWRLLHTPRRRSPWALLKYGLDLLKHVAAMIVLDRDYLLTRFSILHRAISDALHDRFDNHFGFEMRAQLSGGSSQPIPRKSVTPSSKTLFS